MDRRRFLLVAAATALATACGSTGGSASPGASANKATIELAKGGSFSFTLRPDKAPQTVARFAQKARSGFYNGLTFHRVEDWVVQGGDPTGSGSGGGQVPSEYNSLPFVAGAVGIARTNDPTHMNDSQFFIVKIDSHHLDGIYANFGQLNSADMPVVQGIKIGDKIRSIKIE
jgi:peptidyl-prolyl cis-trans isomerase B (cyclophilin B)